VCRASRHTIRQVTKITTSFVETSALFTTLGQTYPGSSCNGLADNRLNISHRTSDGSGSAYVFRPHP